MSKEGREGNRRPANYQNVRQRVIRYSCLYLPSLGRYSDYLTGFPLWAGSRITHALYPLVTELIDSGPLLIQGPPGYWGTRMPSEGPEFQGAQRSLLHFLSKRYMNFWITEMDLPHHLNEPLCHHMNGPLCHLNGPLSPPEWTFITT